MSLIDSEGKTVHHWETDHDKKWQLGGVENTLRGGGEGREGGGAEGKQQDDTNSLSQ